MAVETAELASAEAVVCALSVRVVGDNTVVACLGRLMRNDDGANILTSSALGHAILLLCLHFVHAFLRLTYVVGLVIVLASLVRRSTDKLEEAFTLLSGSGLICRRFSDQ